jgi:hypothetical protein
MGMVTLGGAQRLLFLTLMAAACSSSSSQTDAGNAPVDAGVEGGVVPGTDGAAADGGAAFVRKIIFGADFDTKGGCADHSETDQCDLYTAELNLSDGSVSDVKRATSTSVSESYPALNPNGTVAYFSVFKDVRHKDLGYVDLVSGKTGTLVSDATWPAVSPDGSTLVYQDVASSLLMKASLGGGGLTVGTPTALTGTKNQQDPDYSFDGRYIVLHEITSSGAVGQVYDLQTKKTTSWGESSGHCGFGGSSLLTVCDNASSGGLVSKTYQEGGSFGAKALFVADLKAEGISPYDSAFAPCEGVSFNYPTFCGDDKHMLVSVSCNQNFTVTFSRLLLIDFTEATPTYRPLGKLLADAYKAGGVSSWTVSCLK